MTKEEILEHYIWKHIKSNGLYVIEQIGKLESTLEDHVIYSKVLEIEEDGPTTTLDLSSDVWIRPLKEWCEQVRERYENPMLNMRFMPYEYDEETKVISGCEG